MKKLFIKMRGNKYHRFTKATARAILVAAIILALAATACAIETSRHYALKPFSNYTEYSVESGSENKDLDEITAHYIPDGFSSSYCCLLENKKSYEFSDMYGNQFNIYISSQEGLLNFDTENYDCRTVEINGVEYVLFSNGKDYNGILCNRENYYFIIDGTISTEDLLAIAENVY